MIGIITLLAMQSGCDTPRWALASLFGGALSFGSGLLVGSTNGGENIPIGTQTVIQHECFLNDQPIDCSLLPSNQKSDNARSQGGFSNGKDQI
jgi:hypothetical protein